MKKYVKVELVDNIYVDSEGVFNTEDNEYSPLFYLLNGASIKSILKCLNDSGCYSIQGENAFLYKEKRGTAVIYTEHNCSLGGKETYHNACLNKHDSWRFTIDIENLKEVVVQWEALYDKRAPVIYFVREDVDHLDDGPVIVRRTLERAYVDYVEFAKKYGQILKEHTFDRDSCETIGFRALLYNTIPFFDTDGFFRKLLIGLGNMAGGPEFARSYDELSDLSDKLMTGKWLAQKKHIKTNKKYMKISVNYNWSSEGWMEYEDHSDDKDYILFYLVETLRKLKYNEIQKFINDPSSERLEQTGEIYLSKNKENIEIYVKFGPLQKNDNEMILGAVITLENLRQLALDWKALIKKSASEIYFIKIDDGSIVVRETLD